MDKRKIASPETWVRAIEGYFPDTIGYYPCLVDIGSSLMIEISCYWNGSSLWNGDLSETDEVIAWRTHTEVPSGKGVTRVEVIDYRQKENCRAWVGRNLKNVELSFQDDNRTLKVFIDGNGEEDLKTMYENMQYYMEYCQQIGYVTPMEWLEKHKHF